MKNITHPARMHRIPVAPATAVLTVLADGLFFKHPPGWSLALFLLVLLVLIRLRARPLQPTAPPAILSSATLLLIAGLCMRVALPSVLMCLLGLLGVALSSRLAWSGDSAVWARRIGRYVLSGWNTLFRDLPLIERAASRSGRAGRCAHRIKHWLLPLLMTGGFLLLFAAANPLLARQLGHVIERLRALNLPGPLRILFWMAVALWVWSLMRVRRAAASPPRLPRAHRPARRAWLPPAALVNSLVLFNLLFAVQNGMDTIYLWGHLELPDGLTYAEYAHRGAYVLVLTAILAAAFVLATFRNTRSTPASPLARRLVVLWIAQNVLLTASSAWRLQLYVDVYSLTRLRVAAAIWMGLVALGLLWIVARLLLGRSNRWLLNANALSLLAALYVTAFLNTDALIARFNVRHCREITGRGAPLDVAYLGRLGIDALPALDWVRPRVADTDLSDRVRALQHKLQHRLAGRLGHWQAWTLHTRRLFERLPPAAPEGQVPQ